MVSVDRLCCLDALIWLQSGNAVGALTLQHQTTVSRNQKKCAKSFGIEVLKCDGLWQIKGDRELLQLERGVHQAARLKFARNLRLEAAFSPEGACPTIPGETWVAGTSRIQTRPHISMLLEERVIDAWLTPATPSLVISDALVEIPLWDTPLAGALVVHRDLRQEQPLAALIESLMAQHQQRPVVLHTPEISASTSPINHQLMP